MNKKTGRPKKALKLGKGIKVNVNHQQYFIIEEKAARAGVKIAVFMRQAAVFGQVKTRWSPEERELFKQLVGMSNDLHHLGETARTEGAQSAMLCFRQYRDQIDIAIKQLADHA